MEAWRQDYSGQHPPAEPNSAREQLLPADTLELGPEPGARGIDQAVTAASADQPSSAAAAAPGRSQRSRKPAPPVPDVPWTTEVDTAGDEIKAWGPLEQRGEVVHGGLDTRSASSVHGRSGPGASAGRGPRA